MNITKFTINGQEWPLTKIMRMSGHLFIRGTVAMEITQKTPSNFEVTITVTRAVTNYIEQMQSERK